MSQLSLASAPPVGTLCNTVRDVWANTVAQLGYGYTEAVYQKALVAALAEQGILTRTEVDCPVIFNGTCVGMGRADIVCPGLVIEVKLGDRVTERNEQQVRAYSRSLSGIERVRYASMVVCVDPCSGQSTSEVFGLRKAEQQGTNALSCPDATAGKTKKLDRKALDEKIWKLYTTLCANSKHGSQWMSAAKVHRLLVSALGVSVDSARANRIVKGFMSRNFDMRCVGRKPGVVRRLRSDSRIQCCPRV